MTIISQFILHSSLAFHNKEPAIENSIAFFIRTHAYLCIFEQFRGDSIELTVSSIKCQLTSGRYCTAPDVDAKCINLSHACYSIEKSHFASCFPNSKCDYSCVMTFSSTIV